MLSPAKALSFLANFITPASPSLQQDLATENGSLAKDQSSATLATSGFNHHLLTELAQKIRAALQYSSPENRLAALDTVRHSQLYANFIWPSLVQLAEKLLSHIDPPKQPADLLAQKIGALPEELKEKIGEYIGLPYWQAKTNPTYQNRPAYFLYDQHHQAVLDGHNQPIHHPLLRYHLLVSCNIRLKHQQQALLHDPQLYTLFCDPQFRQNLLTQLAKKLLGLENVEKPLTECRLLLFFLCKQKKAMPEECEQIVAIFWQHLARASSNVVEQALKELIQYLPYLSTYDSLQLKIINLVRYLSQESGKSKEESKGKLEPAKPSWLGQVWANVIVSMNLLATRSMVAATTWTKSYESDIVNHLQQIIARLQNNEGPHAELIFLAQTHKYLLNKVIQSGAAFNNADQISQVINKNLPHIREELDHLINDICVAPQEDLNRLLKVLQLSAFFTETQRKKISTILKANVKALPKKLWSQLLPLLHPLKPPITLTPEIPFSLYT